MLTLYPHAMTNSRPPHPTKSASKLSRASCLIRKRHAQFKEKLGALLLAGMPPACPVTSRYDLKAIDAWLFPWFKTIASSVYWRSETSNGRHIKRPGL